MATVLSAPDAAQFTLDVRTAEGLPDPGMTGNVQFVNGNDTTVKTAQHVAFSIPRTFAVPAWPAVNALRCDVALSACRAQSSRFFVPRADAPTEVTLTAMRDPASWVPAFRALDSLDTDRFARLLDVLKVSNGVDIKHGPAIGSLTTNYDVLAGPQGMNAKMALLNLYAALSDEIDPVSTRPWFAGVREIVRIDQERFVAEADDQVRASVRAILDRLPEFHKKLGFFTELSPGQHTENFPDRYAIGELTTVKGPYEQGNVQLTVTTGTEKATGRQVCLLDVDMDEHSQLLLHTGDLFVHPFTGGTHPIDMHEYIVAHSASTHEDRVATIDLGYQLVRGH